MIPVTVAERVRAVIAEELGIEVSHDAEQLDSDLRADSLDVAQIQLALEHEFKVEIAYDGVVQHMTVGAVIAYVERRVGTAAR